ncbi:putative oxidoreductase YciK [Pseudovibrio sp. Ad46]|uniref:SDR family NAD(P)-dependent oxidoreductase n=1 Tax=unclassified Pseudovibrio TaxID=2627060 RepID=UPI0007B27E75|nr:MULTISPECIES: SDR family NAD(P)-dependent oxidoreductase [unclassified Pseudovibrio]KZK93950.1 putative oxidoreductase YciK [Pseudovibrio sp. Ad46]KZL00163.1 putative oxidoreductase YciK [Pseudovibrio sp. Ad5]
MSSKNASIIKQASMVLNTFTPQRRKPNPVYAIPEEDKHISGKIIVFTGGTDGMRRAAVSTLHKLGANLIILGRNEEKGMAVARELNAIDGGGRSFYPVIWHQWRAFAVVLNVSLPLTSA